MKKTLEWGEWYPVYTLEDAGSRVYPEVDIPDDKIEWYERVMSEFSEVQDYLAALKPPGAM